MNYSWIYLILYVLFSSCESTSQASKTEMATPKEAKGGRTYGGVFRLSEAEYIKSLYPPNITDAFSYRVASQVYEGLFKFDPASLKVIPGLVESYEMDNSR